MGSKKGLISMPEGGGVLFWCITVWCLERKSIDSKKDYEPENFYAEKIEPRVEPTKRKLTEVPVKVQKQQVFLGKS